MAGRKKDGTDALVVARCYAGGREGKPQKQAARKGACTQKQKAAFLDVLEQTSNVSEACRQIGKSSSAMYALRERDPAFYDAWMTALEQGFAALEMEMLRRARFGQDVTEYRAKDDGTGEEVVKRVHSYDNRLGLQLLAQHLEKVAAYRVAKGRDAPDGALALAEIKARLLTIKDRTDEGGGG